MRSRRPSRQRSSGAVAEGGPGPRVRDATSREPNLCRKQHEPFECGCSGCARRAQPDVAAWPRARESRVRPLGFRARLTLALAVGGALLLVVVGVLVASLESYRQPSGIREHNATIGAASTVEKLVLDLETGVRGYVITGDELFLQPWEEARPALPQAVAALDRDAGPQRAAEARRIGDEALAYLREYAIPLVTLARTDRDAAATRVATAEGKRRVDRIRELVDRFDAAEQAEIDAIRTRTDRRATTALVIGISGLVATVLLVVLFALYLSRAVVRPVRRLAGATASLGAGNLTARVADPGRGDELGRLATTFNAMADSLQETRDTLEAQNAELEAQQAELQDAVDQLADERDRVLTLNRHAQRLASEAEVEMLAVSILDELGQVGRADVGAVYAAASPASDALRLVSARGLRPEDLPVTVEEGDGLVGRAVAERRPVAASWTDAGLRIRAWGSDITLRHELHLPLVQGRRVLGVVTLARVGERAFSPEDTRLLATMADQAALAVAGAVALARARHEASVTRALLDASPDGVALTDIDGHPLLANAQMLELVGVLGIS